MANIKKLGIIAGGGEIPSQVVACCQKQGIPFFVIALEPHASKDLVEGVPHVWARLGKAGFILKQLKKENVTDIVLIGSVKRPTFGEVRPDWGGIKIIANIMKRALGDDGLLRLVVKEIEKKGFNVVGVDDFLPELLAPSGIYGKVKPSKQDMIDIDRGIEIVKELGRLDVGQGAVIQEGIVLAIEAVEGTDAMLHRAGEIKRKGKGPVFIKLKKVNQDGRIDLPTIGKNTIATLIKYGFSGVAIGAGEVLIVNKDEVVKEADKHGIFIIGMNV